MSVRHSESEVRCWPAFTCHSLDERLALPPGSLAQGSYGFFFFVSAVCDSPVTFSFIFIHY